MPKSSKESDQRHPLSFLKTAFGDAQKYPNISVVLESDRRGEPLARLTQIREGRPKVFHTIDLSNVMGTGIYGITVSVEGREKPLTPMPALMEDPKFVVDKLKDYIWVCA